MKELILNPVENLPFLFQAEPSENIRGFYVSDKIKNDETVKNSLIGFSGREKQNSDVLAIYNEWKEALCVDYLSMRLLSGLHAHIILFMGLGNIGDKILILPEIAGGHYATPLILKRLGYQIVEAIPDLENYTLDISATIELAKQEKPDLIFMDRSEGLYYEDYTELVSSLPQSCGKIFDASQYLTNIMMRDFKTPFDMGFDVMMSTMHKNFPGPQKALICSRTDNIFWKRALNAANNYVSNLHVENIYIARTVLKQKNILATYSKQMLKNSVALESLLFDMGVPIVKRNHDKVATHHIWVRVNDKETAFRFYKKMEQCGLLVNYRKLPYELGYGIRMGTSACTLQGINSSNIYDLAQLIARVFSDSDISEKLITDCQNFIDNLVPLPKQLGVDI